MLSIPSPAIAVVGRHNSGKTTLVVKLISALSSRGFDVGSIKHHSHGDFEIDYPGKDSYRHREAGSTETVIASPNKIARVKTLSQELECCDILASMPGHDIVIVEGYRKSGLPTIEIMRSANKADSAIAEAFAKRAKDGDPLGLKIDDVQFGRETSGVATEKTSLYERDIQEKMPSSNTVAIVTDIDCAKNAAQIYGIPYFDPDDIESITTFLIQHYCRSKISVVIQAGGESRRMGQSKALVDYHGRPLITRLIKRMIPAADELIITTNEQDKLTFLLEEFSDVNLRFAKDVYAFRGALPGLFTALNAATYQYVALVACDMIFASPRLVVAEAIEMAETDCDIVVPFNQHGFEPFHSMYRKDSCLKAVNKALERGDTRVQAIFDDPDLTVIKFEQSRVLAAEPRGGCFINANTPDELSSIESNFPESN